MTVKPPPYAVIGHSDPCDEWPLHKIIPYIHVMDVRPRHGKSQMPQALRCMHGQHDWSNWGPYRAAPPDYTSIAMVKDEPPVFTPVEAYRWRHCQCGAAERETWHDHTVKRFNPGDDR